MEPGAAPFNYPIVLKLRDKLVAVVGAGTVGQRKLRRLLQAGARVRLIDPCLLEKPYLSAAVESIGHAFTGDDLQGVALVFACTDSEAVNQQVTDAARKRNLFCCRADRSQDGDFALPAVLGKGRLNIAVSTSGDSPALAAAFRDRLAEQVPDWWSLSLELSAALRRKWLTEQIDKKYNQQVLRNFLTERLLPLFESGKLSEIDKLLIESFGDEFSLERLQVQLPEGIR